MALLTLTQAKTFAGITTTDVTRDAALQEIIDEAIDAVKQHLNNGAVEATAYTQILDLPSYPSLVVPYFPVAVDGFRIWVNMDAGGDPAKFTDDFELDIYNDFALDVGPTDINYSHSGVVRFLTAVYGSYGLGYERPIYSLAIKVVPVRGAVKITYTGGYPTVPPAIRAALNIIVRKIFNARKFGVPFVSESLNGYSYSSQNTATAEGLITGDPTVRKLLQPFTRPQVGSYF